ncbi:hypothetical protein D3C80_2214340 [compost metagenome]
MDGRVEGVVVGAGIRGRMGEGGERQGGEGGGDQGFGWHGSRWGKGSRRWGRAR